LKQTIPPERLAAFDLIVETAKTERVVIMVRSRAVRRQYLRAFLKRGVDLNNIFFKTLGETDRQAAP
jgi:hypothetical protein